MTVQRIFIYQGNIDAAFRAEAKQSLLDAGWETVMEIDTPVQLLMCTGADRSTCIPGHEYPFVILAGRSS